MSSANISWLFNKEYFKDLDYAQVKSDSNTQKIERKVQHIIEQKPNIPKMDPLSSTRFEATTMYPGLIIGSGNSHEISGLTGQATLGFSFDYTSGLPVVAGSSIKGVLRSAFQHPKYIAELLNDADIDVSTLEKEIFNNADIFYDANIIKADGDNRILGDDYLTPHKEPLKDPIPIRFIKVLPDVTFSFEFELDDGLLSKVEKVSLFRKILEDLGIGAKTNVGYGKLSTAKASMTPEEEEQDRIDKAKAEEEKKAKEEEERENLLKEKEQKKEAGLSSLLDCKTLADGFKLLKDSFGKKPNLTSDEKVIVEQYFKKQKNLSKSDLKVFKKYGIS